MTKQMHLVTHLIPGGYHLSGWRHPRAYERRVMNYSVLAGIARTAEQANLDAVFIADGNAIRQTDGQAGADGSRRGLLLGPVAPGRGVTPATL